MKLQNLFIALLFFISSAQSLAETTVGSYLNTNNSTLPLSYTSSDLIQWNLSNKLPLPIDAAVSPKTLLLGVACDKTGVHCVAVGSYQQASNNIAPFSYVSPNSGNNWTLSNPLPLPSDIASNGIQKTELRSVTCDETGVRCVAVGQYLTYANNIAPLIYVSGNSGVSWSLIGLIPKPSDTAGNGSQVNTLTSVG